MLEEGSKCESCGDSLLIDLVYVEYTNESKPYILCDGCLNKLITRSLTPEDYFSLLAKGHSEDDFSLHGDFYIPENGIARQPSKIVGPEGLIL